ncbi:MAG: prolipoprotein diacylglyceryl transferase [Alistipes sp.]|nr:prolipoprotein diacylglyceryl transferase [Alistipes sp.]
MNILSIVWNWDPTLVMLGDLDIRWYGLMWAIAILVAERICSMTFKHEGLPTRTLESAFIWIVLGTFIGARVGHCLFYEPETYLAQPWRIITGIREGGMASHGATIGIILGIFFFVRRNHLPFIWGLDRIAIVAPISGALIRLGNLFNSEIVGYPSDVPWSFKFVYHDARRAWYEFNGDVPADIIADIPSRHPAQLYEALCYIATFAILMWLYFRKDIGRRRPGILFGVCMIGIFLTRFFIEFLKERQEAFEEGWALDMGQLLSVPFIVIGITIIIVALRRPVVADVNAVVDYANKKYAEEDKKSKKNGKRGK